MNTSDEKYTQLRETCFWNEGLSFSVPNSKNQERNCNVAIIGAGYTGLAAALVLARAGKNVQVFEKTKVGDAASARNGGILSGNLRVSFADAIQRFGQEPAIRMMNEGKSAREDFSRFVDEENIDCDHSDSGRFTGTLFKQDLGAVQQDCDLMNEHLDIGAQVVDRRDVHQFTGARCYVGGAHRPDIGMINPAKFLNGLLRKVLAAGATIHSETPALEIARKGASFVIKSRLGETVADKVIMATNGYTDKLDGWFARRVVPVKSRIVVTEEVSNDVIASLFPKSSACGEKRFLYRYFRSTPDGKRILVGAREPSLARNVVTAANYVKKLMVEIFPQLASVNIEYSWAGNVAFTRDELPGLFERNGILYACGYCGSGTIWARWMGEKAAYKVLGAPEAETFFFRQAPKAIPFYNGKPWFLPAMVALNGMKDQIKR